KSLHPSPTLRSTNHRTHCYQDDVYELVVTPSWHTRNRQLRKTLLQARGFPVRHGGPHFLPPLSGLPRFDAMTLGGYARLGRLLRSMLAFAKLDLSNHPVISLLLCRLPAV